WDDALGEDQVGGRAGPHHSHRGGLVAGRTVTELAVAVASPAPDGAGVGEGAGVPEPRGDGGDVAGEVAHLHGSVLVAVRTVAELAGAVESPAPDGAVIGKGAGVIAPRIDGDDVAGEVAHLHRGGLVASRSVAELAVEVPSPAPDGAGGEGAGVLVPRGDGD